jgi:hypothetical protein
MSKTLGILTGKKREYNGLILKSLVTGAKKTIQIAEYVHLSQEDAPVKANYNEVRQINSIICRKNSRLEELSNKAYIKRENNLWKLTFKGISVALTLFNDFADAKKFIDFTQIERNFKDALKEFDENPIYALLRTTKADNIIKKQFNRIENDPQFGELFLFKLRAYTSDMIRESVNIDIMPELELKLLMAYKILFWMIGEEVS